MDKHEVDPPKLLFLQVGRAQPKSKMRKFLAKSKHKVDKQNQFRYQLVRVRQINCLSYQSNN